MKETLLLRTPLPPPPHTHKICAREPSLFPVERKLTDCTSAEVEGEETAAWQTEVQAGALYPVTEPEHPVWLEF